MVYCTCTCAHLYQPPCLHNEGILQSVDNEAIDLLLCHNWCLTNPLQYLYCCRDDSGVGPGSWDHLHQWNVLRRVDLRVGGKFISIWHTRITRTQIKCIVQSQLNRHVVEEWCCEKME